MQFLETMGNMITKYSGFFIEGVENTLIAFLFHCFVRHHSRYADGHGAHEQVCASKVARRRHISSSAAARR